MCTFQPKGCFVLSIKLSFWLTLFTEENLMQMFVEDILSTRVTTNVQDSIEPVITRDQTP